MTHFNERKFAMMYVISKTKTTHAGMVSSYALLYISANK